MLRLNKKKTEWVNYTEININIIQFTDANKLFKTKGKPYKMEIF